MATHEWIKRSAENLAAAKRLEGNGHAVVALIFAIVNDPGAPEDVLGDYQKGGAMEIIPDGVVGERTQAAMDQLSNMLSLLT